MSFSSVLRSIRQGLGIGGAPLRFESAQIAGLHWVNIVGEDDGRLISENVYCGFSSSFEMALSKAVSEKIEREAFRKGRRRGLLSCQTERSDGFAAYPRALPEATTMARRYALNEAIERFVWATWWDNTEIAFNHEVYELDSPHTRNLGATASVLAELGKKVNLNRVHIIAPKFVCLEEHREVLILIAETGDGVFSGGACGLVGEREQTLLRGSVELLRHSLVPQRSRAQHQTLSFYERRLFHFSSEKGLDQAQRRIAQNGAAAVQLPQLEIDEQISHPSEHSHVVHRCRFKGQPEFVGGALERLCL